MKTLHASVWMCSVYIRQSIAATIYITSGLSVKKVSIFGKRFRYKEVVCFPWIEFNTVYYNIILLCVYVCIYTLPGHKRRINPSRAHALKGLK